MEGQPKAGPVKVRPVKVRKVKVSDPPPSPAPAPVQVRKPVIRPTTAPVEVQVRKPVIRPTTAPKAAPATKTGAPAGSMLATAPEPRPSPWTPDPWTLDPSRAFHYGHALIWFLEMGVKQVGIRSDFSVEVTTYDGRVEVIPAIVMATRDRRYAFQFIRCKVNGTPDDELTWCFDQYDKEFHGLLKEWGTNR